MKHTLLIIFGDSNVPPVSSKSEFQFSTTKLGTRFDSHLSNSSYTRTNCPPILQSPLRLNHCVGCITQKSKTILSSERNIPCCKHVLFEMSNTQTRIDRQGLHNRFQDHPMGNTDAIARDCAPRRNTQAAPSTQDSHQPD